MGQRDPKHQLKTVLDPTVNIGFNHPLGGEGFRNHSMIGIIMGYFEGFSGNPRTFYMEVSSWENHRKNGGGHPQNEKG